MTSLAPESGLNPIHVLDYDENGEGPWSAPGWAEANGRAWQAGWQGRRSGLVERQWSGLPRDWVTAPGRSFTGPWNSFPDRGDIRHAQLLQISKARSLGASTATQQVATRSVQRQTQHIEQVGVALDEASSWAQHARRSWASVMKAAGARVKSFSKASTEEIKKKPIATIGVVSAVVALVYTVASHAN